MRPSVLFIDTTRVQAAGDGAVDFKSNTLDFRVVPRAKQPQLFSAETPLQVIGTFSDFSVGANPEAILASAVRILTSPWVVPFEWAFKRSPAADGEVACERAWSQPIAPTAPRREEAPAGPFTH
jgi:hypothetical protein